MDLPEWCPREIIVPHTEAEKDAVRLVQRVLRVEETGRMDSPTEAALRGIQRRLGLQSTGIIDKATANMIDRLRWA